jgi:sucrose phosphorylase
VSFKANPDGSRSVYELNISYFDALSEPAGGEPLSLQVARFLVSQAIMLALAGVPGIYAHSLLGSRSWQEGVALTGHNRTINRERINRPDLEQALSDRSSLRSQVLAGYRDLLAARASSPAFHPFGEQQVLFLKDSVFALLRISPDGQRRVLALHSVSDKVQSVEVCLGDLGGSSGPWRDLIKGKGYAAGQEVIAVRLEPYEVSWLEAAAPE